MLNNLFSSFDTKNFIIISFLIVNLYIYIVFSIKRKINQFFIIIKNFFLFLLINVRKNYYFMSLFSMIFFLNLFRLNFYRFNLTRQFRINLVIILIFWLPVLIISLRKKKNSFLIHILPIGTRNILIPIIILIELLSFFIRPLTLFLRLRINIIAGHVLVSLIRIIILEKEIIFFIIIYIYILIKLLVRFIQAYIITTLLTLYIEEI